MLTVNHFQSRICCKSGKDP